MRKALLVDDGRSLGNLAAVRSLARGGWMVGCASPDRRGFAATSRRLWRHHRVPAVNEDLDGFVSTVAAITKADGYDLVFAGSDAELLALSAEREGLSARLPYPDHEVVEGALDKIRVDELARASGLATPATFAAGSTDPLPLPVVVKAASHWNLGATGAPLRLDPKLCVTAAEVERRVAEIEGHGGTPVLQEHVPGVLMAYTVLCRDDGEIVAAVQQEVDGLDPSPAGSSTRARTVTPDPALVQAVGTMMRALGWLGVAELQFMRRGSERPKLIDLNPRFYGSMSLAIAAGVDLPLLWAKLSVGEAVQPVAARAGVRYQWFHGDLVRMAAERRGGLFRDLTTTLIYGIGAAHPLWDRADPAPALRYVARIPQRALARRRT